ncbi:MAG: hypothetical protein AABZ44_02090 [Elusimicrobiota bacterium]
MTNASDSRLNKLANAIDVGVATPARLQMENRSLNQKHDLLEQDIKSALHELEMLKRHIIKPGAATGGMSAARQEESEDSHADHPPASECPKHGFLDRIKSVFSL